MKLHLARGAVHYLWLMLSVMGASAHPTHKTSNRWRVPDPVDHIQSEVILPPGVRAVWSLDKAFRETTSTRERVCLNGLWRWQPVDAATGDVPTGHWGYFKVPGCWPGITDYEQKDCQTVFAHPDWRNENLARITAAWYQREITVPAAWKGRRITINAEYINSLASIFVDGKKAGELRFPAGELELTSICKPGSKHVLSILVVALPLKAVMTTYTDTNAARDVRGTVARRGLCGDVFLTSGPQGARLSDVKVETSVRRKEIAFRTSLLGLSNKAYAVQADVRRSGGFSKRFVFLLSGVTPRRGQQTFTAKWMPDKLWNTNTPENQFTAQVSLLDSSGKVCDTSLPERFGFREFWIKGKDFYLNGSRIYLSSIPFDNAQIGGAWATYDGARETMLRMKSFGINFVYTHNYDCEPGSHLSFEEILRAADDVGMLVAFTQPHFSAYDWKSADAERTNGYARHAEFYCSVAQNHPSVVAYAMSHNATSYDEAKNPDMIDGIQDARDTWSKNNVQKALRAEAIVKSLDPSRIVYHHSSGNLGSMYTENFYVNFAPQQELSDWFEHWATKGVKPLFLCEYGAPFSWDWTMYRGWFKGKREWGSANVPWEFCLAEWNAQFIGDKAYDISEMEKANIRWEARQFKTREGWHRWDYPNQVSSTAFEERNPIFASYITDNWRAFRTWGVSGISPWEYEVYWKLRPGVDRSRKPLQVDWERLQRPGFSADYVDSQFETMPTAYQRSDWIPTVAAQALIRNEGPLLAYIGGKPGAFTSKDHNFLPGETLTKQIIIINNSRETVSCGYAWHLGLPHPFSGAGGTKLAPGTQERIPIRIILPSNLVSGKYDLSLTVRFGAQIQKSVSQDKFTIDVMSPPPPISTTGMAKIALFDPMGETGPVLDRLGYHYDIIQPSADLSKYSFLIIGRNALGRKGAVPDFRLIRDGLRVLVFEQYRTTLEQRLGFRVVDYGLRQAFPRIPGHPLLEGLEKDNLHDWRGEATLTGLRLDYTLKPMYGPMVKWCGMDLPHVWRAGCRGNVASTLIEKPARGDFLPIIDGGYSLQYSPLMLYREGNGMILFCQMDVGGRTESDPAAERLVRNMLRYMASWKPAPGRQIVYVGDPEGKAFLDSAGLAPTELGDETVPATSLLVVGPGGAERLKRERVAKWLKSDGRILLVGIKGSEANGILPFRVQTNSAEHIASYFNSPGPDSTFAGICSADVHNRDPRSFYLVVDGAETLGDGIAARSPDGKVAFCQIVPWQFEAAKHMNQKRTFRRAAFLFSRLAANMGAAASTPLTDNLIRPWDPGGNEKRWLSGLYLDVPEEWDDPYRFFGW